MTDEPIVTTAKSVNAGELHPTTPVVTAFLHNQLMAEAQLLLNDVVAAFKAARWGIGAAVAFIVGMAVGHVL